MEQPQLYSCRGGVRSIGKSGAGEAGDILTRKALHWAHLGTCPASIQLLTDHIVVVAGSRCAGILRTIQYRGSCSLHRPTKHPLLLKESAESCAWPGFASRPPLRLWGLGGLGVWGFGGLGVRNRVVREPESEDFESESLEPESPYPDPREHLESTYSLRCSSFILGLTSYRLKIR